MIKAIVFDYGNVISQPQDRTCYARMSALTGLSEDELLHFFWKYRSEYDRGTIRGEEMYLRVLADAGISGSDAALAEMANKLVVEDLGSWAAVSESVTDWGLSIQACGYTLGILSNMPFDFLELYGDKIRMFREANTAVFSCDVGQIKPERDIYGTLIARLGRKPEEIVFFDDLEVNVEGARKAGIQAFLWTGLEQAKTDWNGAVTRSREPAPGC